MSFELKIIGGVSFAIGLLLVVAFPTGRYYQPDRFAMSGVLIGLGLMAIGIYLISQ